MKILVISNLYPPHEIGGYEIICRDVSERLTQFGHDVRVLTSDHHIQGRPEVSQPYVHRELRVNGFFGHPWLPIQQLYTLESHNHRALLRHIQEFKPDVIYVWNMGGISKSLLHRLQDSGIPTAFYLSDHWIASALLYDVWLQWWNTPNTATNKSLRALLALTGGRKLLDHIAPTYPPSRLRFEHISFCSAFLRDFTASKGWPVNHATVIHCCIDTAAFTVKTDHSSFSKLLWVGRLSPDKDPVTAIRAVAAARSCGLTGLTLDLYGNGTPDFLARVDDEIAKLQLTAHVRRKSAPAAEMRRLYSQYDALLFTSNWGEPFAITPLEAMASGLPIITTLDGGQPELARHGENCLIAEATNHELFATRIAELAASPRLRSHLAQTSLEEVRRRFDVNPSSREIESFLLHACSSLI